MLLSQQVLAQTWSPASPVTVCPGETGNYVLTGIPANYRFTSGVPPFVARGRLIHFPVISSGSATFQVQWDDTPSGGKLTVAFEQSATSGNTTSWKSAINQELTARIRSVAFQPGPVGGNTVPYCSTAPFTLDVAIIQFFLNVPNEQITDYLWEVPTGWGVSGATLTSLGGTRSGFQVYKGTRSITLTPTPGGDVDLRVFQYSGTCNQTYYSSQPNKLISFPGLFRIRRQPTVAITAGPSGVTCGDQTPITYTAQASQSQGNPSFGWTYPSGWAVQGPSSGASITLVPNGSSGGTVSVQALYNCSGVGGVATSAPVNVTLRQLPKPLITTAPALQPSPAGQFGVLCAPTIISGTIAGTNANTRYVWIATDGLQVSEVGGTPGTSVTTANSSVTIYPGASGGQGSIKVSAYNSAVSGCTSPGSNLLNLAFGPPQDRGGQAFIIRGQRFDYAANGPGNGWLVCLGEHIYVRLNTPSPGIVLNSKWEVYRTDVQPEQLVQSQSNAGGDTQMTVYIGFQAGMTYEARYQERNVCGMGPVNICRLEAMDCDKGYEPFRTAQLPTKLKLAAYPNPAHDDLTLEQGGGRVRIYNAFGQPVRSSTAKPGRLRLDTSQLPAGLYFLETRDAQGNPQRQPIRIEH